MPWYNRWRRSIVIPFTGNDNIGTENPTVGVLHVTTTVDNSQARLTALGDAVSLEIDVDGDGVYEYVDSILWSDHIP